MNFEELRIECIKLAISAGKLHPEEIVDAAGLFERYVTARGDWPTPSQCKEIFDSAVIVKPSA